MLKLLYDYATKYVKTFLTRFVHILCFFLQQLPFRTKATISYLNFKLLMVAHLHFGTNLDFFTKLPFPSALLVLVSLQGRFQRWKANFFQLTSCIV
ncbi:MAG: hypothetical protein ACK56I_23830, partial [bacterium]